MIFVRKLFFLLLTFVFIYFIYQYFSNQNVNYVFISDRNSKYNDYMNSFLSNKYHHVSFNDVFKVESPQNLFSDIQNNRTIWQEDKEYFIKKVLRESDYLIIDVGMIELSKNYSKGDLNYNNLFFNKMYLNIKELIIEIKKYAQGKIIFIGYYNPSNYYDSKTDEFFYNVDLKLNKLMIDNDISYISLYELIKSHKLNNVLVLDNEVSIKIFDILRYYIN